MKQESAFRYGNTLAMSLIAAVLLLLVLGVATGRDIRHMGNLPGRLADSVTDPLAEADESAVPDTGTDAATLAIATQAPGMTVSVSHVALSSAGWVVVHEIDGGHVLNALGARRLDAGVHADVAVELLRMTDPGRTYAIILYADNGNKEFEIRGDLPMIDAGGNPLMQAFRTFGGGAGGQ